MENNKRRVAKPVSSMTTEELLSEASSLTGTAKRRLRTLLKEVDDLLHKMQKNRRLVLIQGGKKK